MKILPERLDQVKDKYILRDIKPCMKKPVPIRAIKMYTEFQVEAIEGNYKTGKPGDYLMCGVDDELYICDKAIFEKTYDWL